MHNNEIINKLEFLIESGVDEFLEDSPQNHYLLNIKENEKIKNKTSLNYKNVNLNEIDTLTDLKIFIEKFDKCNLKNYVKSTVFADGNPKSKIMLIGEAPGAEEDKLGKPFVGKAGKLLDKMLHSINLDRDKVYITNIIPWRPPNNRQPTTEEILLCLPFVQKHIELINPEIIILLGGVAAKAILMTEEGIMRLQGKWYEYSSYGLASPIAVRAMFHPAFLLRSPNYKRQAWEDLKIIQKKILK